MPNPNASTVSAELARQQRQVGNKATFKSLQQKLGTVSDVHPTLPMVKVTYDTGALAAAGNWIPVMHSVMDILQRFGTLRSGLRALVTYFGEVDTIANVTIVGVEDEILGVELQQNNELDTPVFGIFSQG